MQAGARKRTPERSRAGTRHPSSELEGQVIGGWRLDAAIDARGRLWRATNGERRAAVKIGWPASIDTEYRVLRSLQHPHVVRAFDCVPGPDLSYLVLEDLPGGDLVSLAGESPDAWLGAIAILIDTLAYLHRRGLAHRDLKARNVLFDAGDRLCLIDFASACRFGSRWTAAGATPEATLPGRGADPVSPADDVYALACLLYEMFHRGPPGRVARRPVAAVYSPLADLDQYFVAGVHEQATVAHFFTVKAHRALFH